MGVRDLRVIKNTFGFVVIDTAERRHEDEASVVRRLQVLTDFELISDYTSQVLELDSRSQPNGEVLLGFVMYSVHELNNNTT